MLYEFKGASISKNVDLQFFASYMKIAQFLFPENMHRLYCIHTNLAIRGIYQAAKAFVNERTLSKVRIAGHGKDVLEKLQTDIDIDQIPTFLGGTNDSVVEPE